MREPKDGQEYLEEVVVRSDFVLFLEGGIGKIISSTPFVRWVSEQVGHPIDLICSWAEVYAHNPFVNEVRRPDNDLYPLLESKDLIKVDPYFVADFRNKKVHITEAWFRSWGTEPPPQSKCVSLYFEDRELEWAQKYLSKYDKPVILFQPWGASTHLGWETFQVRSLKKETAEVLAKELSKYGTVLVLRNLQQPHLQGFIHPDLELRYSMALVTAADAIVGIDSWMCHASAAVKKPGFFIFMATPPQILSYDIHWNYIEENVCPLHPCNRPWAGVPDQFHCPFGGKCQNLNLDRLLESLTEYLSSTLKEG